MEAPCLDLMNSHWRDWRGSGRSGDRLDDPAWVAGFLRHWKLDQILNPPPAPEQIEALRDLRSLLKRVFDAARQGEIPTTEDLTALNATLAGGPLRRRLEAEVGAGSGHRDPKEASGLFQVTLEPAEEGWPAILAEIAASLTDLLARGDPGRLKVCENPDCGWSFYDDSHGRTRRWCDRTCGNLLKVRRFRARQRDLGASPQGRRVGGTQSPV